MILTAVILVLIAAVIAFWYTSAKVQELALAAARELCRRRHWQLLDDTVSLRKIGLARGQNGRVQCRRQYQFSYTASESERCEATIVMLGSELLNKTEALSNIIQFPTTKKE